MNSLIHLHPRAVILDPELSIFTNPRVIFIDDSSRIDGGVKLEGGKAIVIGRFTHIATGCHINVGGGKTYIGDHSTCSSGVIVCSGMPDIRFRHISAADREEDRHPIRLKTLIGNHTCIFAGAIINPGVQIGNGVIVGAGSVVTCDIPDDEIWWGNPATKQGERKYLRT